MLWVFPEKSDFLGGVHEKPIYKGELPKKGDLEQFVDLRGSLVKKTGVFFLTAICLPHGQLWVILKGTVSLTRC